MITSVFLDLDDTILDFHKAERIALSKTLRRFGVEPSQAVLDRYHILNIQHWQALERGEMTREQVLSGRFRALLQELDCPADAEAMMRSYESDLSVGHYFLPGAREAVERLSKHYRLFLASNGTASVQHARLTSAGLYPYFEKVFISQEVGYHKPSRAYFEECFAQIPGFEAEKAIMVGDSLTSDILGGLRSGLKTCWVNPGHAPAPADIRPDCEIESLSQLEPLLATL